MSPSTASTPDPVCHIVTPVGMLGFGFDEDIFMSTLASLSTSVAPTAIILDSGSTDSGPRKLASGEMTIPRGSYKRDLRKLLRGVIEFEVPLLVGSTGGAGTNRNVDEIYTVIDELARENACGLKVVRIYQNITKLFVSRLLADGKVSGCGHAVPALEQTHIDEASGIVVQMGPEPFVEAMQQHPDFNVILGSRAYDPAPYIAYATEMFRKVRPNYDSDKDFRDRVDGAIAHMGKICECGALCATPKTASVLATVYADGTFDLTPLDPKAKCTPLSVAAHTLYEKARPDILSGPGGWLDLNQTEYENLEDGRSVKVRGAVFHRSVDNGLPFQLKIEGARNRGFRTLYLGIIKDPLLIEQIDQFIPSIKGYVSEQQSQLEIGSWSLDFHIFGRGSNEIVLIGEALALTQNEANGIISSARVATVHGNYPGQKATSGNFAFGIGGTNLIPSGPCAEFCIYHLMDLAPGDERTLFRAEGSFLGSHDTTSNGFDRCNTWRPLPFPTLAISRSPSVVVDPALIKLSPCGSAETLGDLAQVLRSKNAGPYEITLDIMFEEQAIYDAVKMSGLLSRQCVAELYGIQPEQLIWCGFFDQARAFKATLPRTRKGVPVPSGGFMESDVHGSQMYMPLMMLGLPQALREELKKVGGDDV